MSIQIPNQIEKRTVNLEKTKLYIAALLPINSSSALSTILRTSLTFSVCVRQIPQSLSPPSPIPMLGRLKAIPLAIQRPPLRWISLSPNGNNLARISGMVFALMPEPGRMVKPHTSWSVKVFDRLYNASILDKACTTVISWPLVGTLSEKVNNDHDAIGSPCQNPRYATYFHDVTKS